MTAKKDADERDTREADPTLGGALPDPNDDSLHGRLQSRAITYKEFVNEATHEVVVGP